ncbi:MAG: hypothetical protein AAF589_03640 [Planctomycetota bacterium]
MVMLRIYSLFVVAALALLVGCRGSKCTCMPATPNIPCAFRSTTADSSPPEVASAIPVTLADVSDLPCLLPTPGDTYDSLDRSTCQCNAATNTVVASAVELERHWASVLIGCESDAVVESLCLTRSLLALQESDLRNASAAAALTSFYLLAGVEAAEDHAELGMREVEASLERIDRLKGKGLPIPSEVDRDALAIKLDELRDKKLQLRFARIQLNGQLRRLLGCPLDERRFFWPKVEWNPDLDPLDVESLVAEGVAERSDLRSLRLVRCKLEKTTLPVARQVLQVIDGTLGTVSPTPGILGNLRCRDCKDHEISVRCRQLTMIEADATEVAIGKIKSAAYKVVVQQDRVRLAKLTVDARRERLAQLEKIRETEDISVFEISVARGRLFEAESSLVSKVVELKVARVGLREVQGLLAIDCGYRAMICGEHCCTGQCGCQHGSACGRCGGDGCCDCVGE